MPSWPLLLLVMPYLFLALTLCIAMLFALHRARPEDIPEVFSLFGSTFTQLANRMPLRAGIQQEAPVGIENARGAAGVMGTPPVAHRVRHESRAEGQAIPGHSH